MIRLLPLLLCIAPLTAAAQGMPETTGKIAEIAEMAERSHAQINERLQRTSVWLDRYFGDDRSVEEEASSIVRFGINGDYVESESGNTKLRLRGKLFLPRLENKLSLIFEGQPDDGDVTGLNEESGTTELRYSLGDQLLREASVSVGLRGGFSNPTLFTSLRSQQKRQYGKWLLRSTPAVQYDSRKGVSAYFRFDSEFQPKKNELYRSTTRPIWTEEHHQVKLEQTFTQFFKLTGKRYLALDWLLKIASRPHTVVESSRLRIRHRRDLWRNRLFLEVAPGVRFTEEHSHSLLWEGSIRLEWLFEPDKH